MCTHTHLPRNVATSEACQLRVHPRCARDTTLIWPAEGGAMMYCVQFIVRPCWSANWCQEATWVQSDHMWFFPCGGYGVRAYGESDWVKRKWSHFSHFSMPGSRIWDGSHRVRVGLGQVWVNLACSLHSHVRRQWRMHQSRRTNRVYAGLAHNCCKQYIHCLPTWCMYVEVTVCTLTLLFQLQTDIKLICDYVPTCNKHQVLDWSAHTAATDNGWPGREGD